MIQTQAWMGGDRPAPYSTLSKREKYLVSELFREQMQTYAAYWGSVIPEVTRVFWKRARYDAHATMRRQG